jgi:hypothetical protein
MKEDIRYLMANMPSLMALMTELNTLVNNLPKEAPADLTVTAGKSIFKLNRDRDKELYTKFLETINSTSTEKIYNLRDKIDSLLYNSDEALTKVQSA